MSKQRLNLEITTGSRSLIDSLLKRTELPSITELIRRALALFDLVTEHQGKGGKVVFEHANGEREVLRVL